jgi:hypothetical protein
MKSQYSHIVASGCSFTRGYVEHENKDRINYNPNITSGGKYGFVSRLAELLGCTYKNLAIGGIGIRHSIRLLYEYIDNSKEDLSDILLILGVSFPFRYDFINPLDSSKKYCIPQPLHLANHPKFKVEKAKQFNTDPEDLQKFVEVFFKSITSTETLLTEFTQLIDIFQHYCKGKGVDLLIINMMDPDLIVPNAFKFKDGSLTWKQYIKGYDSSYGVQHPNYDDHTRLGNLLYEYIKTPT